mmetsp:Transcript_14669/g.37212  ORF Transcript_14669/g.37212 Transcript_14669/m.37212 type:complete len:220 (-) Transcript_14669:519-1178(-)
MRLRRSGNQQPPTSCQLLPHGRRARPGLRMGSPGEPPGPARPSGEPSNPSYRPRALSRRSFLKATAAASAASANFKNWRRASAPGVSAPTRLGELGLLKPAPVCPGFKSIDSLPLPWPLPARAARRHASARARKRTRAAVQENLFRDREKFGIRENFGIREKFRDRERAVGLAEGLRAGPFRGVWPRRSAVTVSLPPSPPQSQPPSREFRKSPAPALFA